MTVYHWTTKKIAKKVMQEGLRQWSFVCKDQNGWKSEICLAIEGIEVDWENREDSSSWQAILHEHVPLERIKKCIKLV